MLNLHRSRALCALATVAALVAFTGCGGGDKKTGSSGTTASSGGDVASYKAGAQKAANAFKTSAEAASAQVKAATDTAGKVAGLEALKASVNQAADDFSALNAPANVKPDNDQLVTEFRTLASTVDSVEQALKTNNKAAAQAALPKLQLAEAQIGKTIASIQAKIGS